MEHKSGVSKEKVEKVISSYQAKREKTGNSLSVKDGGTWGANYGVP